MGKTEIAALLALGSALCVAVGDVLQQKAAHCIADRSLGHIELVANLLRDLRWWWGALSLWHRTVTGSEWLWAGLLTAAVVVIVIVGNPQAGRSSAPLSTWAAVAAVFGPLSVACVVAARIRGGALAAVLYAFVSGALWGVFAVLSKEVVARLGEGGWAVARTPELYVWLSVALGGLVWGQSAFRAGPLTASMPTLQVSQPVVGAVLGVVVLDETLTTGRAGVMALAAAALVMTGAVFKLARVEAVATYRRVEAERLDAVSEPA